MVLAYYNEIDEFAAKWLRNLVDAGHIAPGYVDNRDIKDVSPEDVSKYTQCHFFAGIGGWCHALRLAGWPDDMPVWTGSPPCQPFSVAGKGKGINDERHLAPVWLDLIRKCRPPVIFGEQVAAAVTKDRWLDTLFDALEDTGYACGAAVIPACGVGAPHLRQRLWFVAEMVEDSSWKRWRRENKGCNEIDSKWCASEDKIRRSDGTGWVANTGSEGLEKWEVEPTWKECTTSQRSGNVSRVGDPSSKRCDREQVCVQQRRPQQESPKTARAGAAGFVCPINGDCIIGSCEDGYVYDSIPSATQWIACADCALRTKKHGLLYQIDVPWRTADWLFCRDGKWRPVESGTFPLVDGISKRVGRLRAYGNAIVPQVAAEFIKAFMDVAGI